MRRVICLLLALVLVGTVCVTTFGSCGTVPVNPQETDSWWGFHQLYRFVAENAIHVALHFKEQVSARLYADPDLDVSGVDVLLAEANALLAKAQACFEKGDYRCAGRKALDAVYLYKQAISDLDALLGGPHPY